MFASGATLCVLHWYLVMSYLPETPRWLVHRGYNEKAMQVLTGIYGDEHEAHIIQQFQLLCERKDHKEPLCLSIGEILDPRYRRALLIAAALQFFQQFSGNSAIVYYSTLVFHQLGYNNSQALLYNALACIPQFIVLVYVVFTLDQHGRKPALLISEMGIGVSLIIIALATGLENYGVQFYMLLAGIVLHRAFFASGMGPVPTVLVSETLPFHIRGRGLALALSINWGLNFLVTATFPFFFAFSPAFVYWVFSACAFVGFAFVYIYVIETKGASLEKIEEMTTSGNSPEQPLSATSDMPIEIISAGPPRPVRRPPLKEPVPEVSPSLRAQTQRWIRDQGYSPQPRLGREGSPTRNDPHHEDGGFKEAPLSPPQMQSGKSTVPRRHSLIRNEIAFDDDQDEEESELT